MSAAVPIIYDQHGRAARASWMHQGGRWMGNRERSHAGWILAEDSRQAVDRYTREQSLALGRWLIANVGLVRGGIQDMTRYSVGNGLVPESQAADDKTAELYQDYFDNWANRCDASRKFTYWQLQALASRAVDGDGDIGVHDIFPGAKADPLIQLIEGHRIGSEGVEDGAKTGWHDGVRTDDFGAPAEYRVRIDDKNWVTVPADRFTLLMEPDRCDQDRGLSALSHAIDHMFDTGDILRFSKMGVKMREAIGFVLYTETGIQDAGFGQIEQGNEAQNTGTGLAFDTVQAGMIPRLKINERVQELGSSRPNPAFAGFLDYLGRDFAVGLGLPFEFVWNPAMQGTAQRFVLAKAQRRFEERQELIRTKMLMRHWALVIGRAIARKDLPPDPKWRAIRALGPAKITVDVGREAQQNREDLKFGSRTLSTDAAEQAQDWRDLRRQLEIETRDLLTRANQLSKEFGITLDKALELLRQNSPNPAPGSSDSAEEARKQAEFKRNAWLAFARDATAGDVVANLTDLKRLTDDVGLPRNKAYDDPYLPVVASDGPPVTGDVVRDPEGDIVGGAAKGLGEKGSGGAGAKNK